MSHSLLYDMSAKPASVSNFSNGWTRAENLHTLKHAYQREFVVLAPAPDRHFRSREPTHNFIQILAAE